jgi:hypothetical protein
VLFVILAVFWRLAGRGPEYRRTGLLFVAGTVACAAALAATALLPADVRVTAWLLLDACYLVGFGIMIGTARPVLTITAALIERFGAFIIIVQELTTEPSR